MVFKVIEDLTERKVSIILLSQTPLQPPKVFSISTASQCFPTQFPSLQEPLESANQVPSAPNPYLNHRICGRFRTIVCAISSRYNKNKRDYAIRIRVRKRIEIPLVEKRKALVSHKRKTKQLPNNVNEERNFCCLKTFEKGTKNEKVLFSPPRLSSS